MKWFKTGGVAAGMELFNGGLRLGNFIQKEHGCVLLDGFVMPLSRETFTPSFQTENILDAVNFRQVLKNAMAACGLKAGKKLGVALPRETVKMMAYAFPEVPSEQKEIAELVKWAVTRNLPLAAEDIKVTWSDMGMDAKGRQVLLVAVAVEDVLAQYRREITAAGGGAAKFTSTALSRFNFFAHALPAREECLYLDLSREFVTMAAFADGVPLFFKTVRRGFANGGVLEPEEKEPGAGHGAVPFVLDVKPREKYAKDCDHYNDIFLVVDHCLMECPDVAFDRAMIVSNNLNVENTRAYLKQNKVGKIFMVLPGALIRIEPHGSLSLDPLEVSLFAAAAGAAGMAGETGTLEGVDIHEIR